MHAPRYCCLLVATAIVAESGVPPSSAPPTVSLKVPDRFQTEMKVEHFRAGDEVLHIDWIENRAIAAMTRYEGYWGPKTGNISDHPWTVDVYNIASSKVEAAIAHAKTGYDADLDEWEEFLLPPPKEPNLLFPSRRARAYLFARYRRKQFHWGHAVSFFSQATQDTGAYVAGNGLLTYEIWGITNDHQRTIVGWFRVSNPKLTREGQIHYPVDPKDRGYEIIDAQNHKDYSRLKKLFREAQEIEERAVRNDPSTKLIEKAKSSEFQPSLTVIDSMIDSLQVK